ncbi:MAG: glycosyltransferase [Clostridia bacterium]|nr:glycosyltransferase [Clostridia bacterium]
MKIAYICDVLGEANNGTVIATINFINRLRESGHEVYIVSSDKSRIGEKDHYYVKSVNFGRFLNRVLEKNGVTLAKPNKPLLREVIGKADLVYIEIPFALGAAAVKIARELGKPIAASFHCQAENFTAHFFLMNSRLANHLTYRVFYKNVFRHCSAIHYPTAFIKKVFYDHTGIDVPAYVISNGVNPKFFEPLKEKREKNEKFTIVCSGRYSDEKAQQTLLRAVGRSDHRDSIRVILAGDGPNRKKYERLARRLGVDCEFGFHPQDELIRILKTSDLYVHTATVEIEAIACTEAIAAGLVALICDSEKSATKAFAADPWVKFRKYDYKTLAHKIDFLIEHPNVLESYKEKYKEAGSVLPLDVCMNKMEAMIESVLKAPREVPEGEPVCAAE